MKDALKNLSERIGKTRDKIQTEEATKNAYIMPFIQILGYDIFNPLEVIPEFTADIGIKKGEKVDYAICRDEEPAILIECKCCTNELCIDNESQLFRYFHTTKAKFGVLTNGVIYKFYTDLEEPNKMDKKPFLEINLLEPEKINYNELVKFSKTNFDAENIRKTADLLKRANSIKNVLREELAEPSEEFVRMIFRKMDCCGSVFTEKVKEKITPLVKSAIDTLVNDRVKANLDTALKSTVQAQEEVARQTVPLENDGVVTTQEETDAWNVIRAILSQDVPPEKIFMRDAKSYCAILFDDNNRKPICRLYFNNLEKLCIGLFDGEEEEKILISGANSLFGVAERLRSTLGKYLELNSSGK